MDRTLSRILVPIDFSEPSGRALRAAGQWVRVFGGQITPLHAYEAITDLDGFHFYGPDKAVSGDLTEILTAILNLLSEVARHEVEAEHITAGAVVMGKPASCIANASLDHDLVIVASHGRTGLSRLFLGSVTEELIRIVPAPVLIVANDAALLPMERILITTDLSPNSAAAFPFGRSIAETTGAAIEILYVHTDRDSGMITVEELENRVRAFVQPHFEGLAKAIEPTVLIMPGNASDAVQSIIRDQVFNLVIMATLGGSRSQQHALGHLPVHVVRAVKTGLLLVNPEHQRDLKRSALSR